MDNCLFLKDEMETQKKCKCVPKTNRKKIWPYDQYYFGEKDFKARRHGEGEHHWTSAQSMECYTGRWIRDIMNGQGEYRWRYLGPNGRFFTYEGDFHANNIHGYGTMSYPDGRIFSGLFQKDVRFGPGVETHLLMLEDVGLWRGRQLVRLTWRPPGPCITPSMDFGSIGKYFLNNHRVILTNTVKNVQESSLFMESLTKDGEDVLMALNMWPKLNEKPFLIDEKPSNLDTFDYDYFNGKMNILRTAQSQLEIDTQDSELIHEVDQDPESTRMYYVWNNTDLMIHIMKICYLHEQRRQTDLNIQLEKILNGPRRAFKPPGSHERHCRSLLMSSFLGYVAVVAALINDCNVYPDVSDMQGNTAVMYATCGDKMDVVHFLVEAGANINSYNDFCLTPLSIAIMKYVCVQLNIPINSLSLAFLPPMVPSVPTDPENTVTDWLISRDPPPEEISDNFYGGGSVTSKFHDKPSAVLYALRQAISFPNSEKDIVYPLIKTEYLLRVNEYYGDTKPNVTQTYIFSVIDLVTEVEKNLASVSHQVLHPHKNQSKHMKNTSFVQQPQGVNQQIFASMDTFKMEELKKTMNTIVSLMKNGADPRLVRCPQPALLMAVIAQSPQLVNLLVSNGVDVNENYPVVRNYYALDVALCYPCTVDNFQIIRTLLENGADVYHRLPADEYPGPTLFHVLLSKIVSSSMENQILNQIFQILAEFDCDPKALYNGRSAIDLIIENQNWVLLNSIIKTSKVDFNQAINAQNQTILVKLFTPLVAKEVAVHEWIRLIGNLLHFGADPFLPCQNDEDKYFNLFEFAYESLASLDIEKGPSSKSGIIKKGVSSKSGVLSKSSVNLDEDSPQRDYKNFKSGVDLLLDFGRDWLVRWIRVRLLRNIILHINKNQHLSWEIMIKDLSGIQAISSWLTPCKCLEIWDILTTSKWKVFKNKRMLKFVLCIVRLCNTNKWVGPYRVITVEERNRIISYVTRQIVEHNLMAKVYSKHPRRDHYVTPEFYVGDEEKYYNICFECLKSSNVKGSFSCPQCGFIIFCGIACLKKNILKRPDSHPCTSYLKGLFSISDVSEDKSYD